MNLKATLIRQPSDEQGTFGVLAMESKRWFSIELPWVDNRPMVSCIPVGTYKVVWSRSPRLKKYTYEIVGVPNRSGIRIHSGNVAGSKPFETHSLGCPLLGYMKGRIRGQKAVLDSRRAVADFERLAAGRTIILEVRDV